MNFNFKNNNDKPIIIESQNNDESENEKDIY